MGESWNKIQLAGIKSIIVVRLFVRYKSAHFTTTFFLFIPNNSISMLLIAGMASKSKQKISTITDRIHTSVVSILNETIGQPSPSTLRASTSRSPGSGVVEGSASGALSSVCEGIYIVAFNLPIF